MRNEVTPERERRIREVLERRQKDLTLVVDNVWDPHNVSAILRSCDAFGLLRVHLYYTSEKWPELGRKSSASARKWVERVAHRDAGSMIGDLRAQGFRVLRTGFSDTARPLMDWDLAAPAAIIVGNEHRGASPELVELVPDELYIPMQGMVQSLNVSVAAAVILYEAFRQRLSRGMYDAPGLEAGELEALALTWRGR
ncbi:MAG: RNA methyltransferase [Desulfovibrionaceae bacterium]|nr:RNA methyltransferase [Desulfovibrionaceae bacterium]